MIERDEFFGIEKLNEEEKEIVENVLKKYHKKISRSLKRKTPIKIKIKQYHKEGGNKEYSINLSVFLNHRKFEVDNSGWDFSAAINKAFEKIISEIEHELHVSDDSHVPKSS